VIVNGQTAKLLPQVRGLFRVDRLGLALFPEKVTPFRVSSVFSGLKRQVEFYQPSLVNQEFLPPLFESFKVARPGLPDFSQ